MSNQTAALVLRTALEKSNFESRHQFFVNQIMEPGPDSFYTRLAQVSVERAEKKLEEWVCCGKMKILADSLELVAQAMLVLAARRPELASAHTIDEGTTYQFPLSYKLLGESDLVVLHLPAAEVSDYGGKIGALRAVAAHIGLRTEGNGPQAEIILVFEPDESNSIGFDSMSVDLYGLTLGDKIRLFDEEPYQIRSLVDIVVSNSKRLSMCHSAGPLSILGWSPELLVSSLAEICKLLHALAIRD